MRWMFALLAACGSKKEPPPPQPASGSVVAVTADAAIADASIDAPSGPVELLHSTGGRIYVSSHVMNKTIKPEHLVDKDFNTAWNSRTGELAGATIEIVAPGSKIEEVKLTIGHTGKGPKGEDYFTMNPRITKVTVSYDYDREHLTVGLDPNVRELQSIKLPKPGGGVKIKVEEVTFGSKANWREVCISEVEAWGTPAPDAKPGKVTVSVLESDRPKAARIESGKSVDTSALCDALMKPAEKMFKDSGGPSIEDPGPHCEPKEQETKLESPTWSSIYRYRMAWNNAHGPMECGLVASIAEGDFVIRQGACGPWDEEDVRVDTATVEDVIPGGEPELVIRLQTSRQEDRPVSLIVCRVAFKAVQCTKPYEIETSTYTVAPRFSKGTLMLDPVDGKPPADLGGPQPLNFDH